MIRVTVEMIPHGDESQSRRLAIMEIANDASGTETFGSYDGTLYAEYTGTLGRSGKVWDFNRQTQSVWTLIGAFLKLWGHTKHSPKYMSKDEG